MSAYIQISVEDFKALQDKELVTLLAINQMTLKGIKLEVISFDGNTIQFQGLRYALSTIMSTLVDEGVCFRYIS